MRFWITLLALFAVALLAACHHRSDPDPALQYDPTRMACRLSLVVDSSSGTYARIDYDVQKRPERVTRFYRYNTSIPDPYTQLTYSGNTVQFQHYYNNQPDSTYGTAIVENGLVKQVITHTITDLPSGLYRTLDTLTATYDASGLPTRFTRTVRHTHRTTDSVIRYRQQLDFTVEDGAVTRIDFTTSPTFVLSSYQPDPVSITYAYTGLVGPNRLLTTEDFDELETLEGYPLYLGKKLPRMMETTNRNPNGSLITQQFAFNYELNDKGFPTLLRAKKTISGLSTVWRYTNLYTYICP